MLRAKFLLIIVILICSSGNIVATEVSIIINETKRNVKSINSNGNIFVEYEHFFKLFNKNLKKTGNNYNLSHKNITITAYPMSFYMLLSDDTAKHIIQLNTPIYSADEILYVPANSLLSAMKEIFGISFDVLKNGIYIDFADNLINYFNPKEVKENIKNISTKDLKNENDIFSGSIDFHSNENNTSSIAHNYSLENINKPALSSLSYSSKSFIISRQSRQLFDRSEMENIVVEGDSDLPSLLPNTIKTENKSLPPFRKYSIPDLIKKEKIDKLK